MKPEYVSMLGNLSLDQPRVVATITEDVVDRAEDAVEMDADALEIRIDMLDRPVDDLPRLFHILRDLSELPIIATNRREGEGGEWVGPERERIDALVSVFDYVDAVDIEYYAGERDDVLQEADEYNLLKIVSFHDTTDTPAGDFIESMIEDMFDVGADVARVVTTAHDRDDVLRMLGSTLRVEELGPVSTMCTGRMGYLGRALTPLFGSKLTYGSIDPVDEKLRVDRLRMALDLLQ